METSSRGNSLRATSAAFTLAFIANPVEAKLVAGELSKSHQAMALGASQRGF